MLGVLAVVNNAVHCWFVDRAFAVRSGITRTGSFVSFVGRYLALKIFISLAYGTFGVATIYLASLSVHPLSGWAEKVVILVVWTLTYPMYVAVVEFVLYRSYYVVSPTTLAGDALWAAGKNWGRIYIFFGIVSLVAMLICVLGPIAIFKAELSYFVRLTLAGLLIGTVLTLARGMKYEFSRLLFGSNCFDSEEIVK